MAEHPLAGRQLTITKLQRAPEGHWTARISLGGVTRAVDCRHGSWMTEVANGRGSKRQVARKHLLPEYAAVLQAKVKRAERREARIGRDCQGDDALAVPPAPQPEDAGSNERKESAMPTATTEKPSAARKGSLMEAVEKALRAGDGPMTAGQLVDAMPKSAFSAKAKAEPFYQVYGRLSAGVKQGKVVKVDKGLFDLAELNPRGTKKRPSA
jgi:hypothetical protein